MTDRRPFETRYADIWALGVILVNMITSRQPWSIASREDCCFSSWLEDHDFLKRMLPMSDGANVIIHRIFQLEPHDRISLSDLRKEIRELGTFFLTPYELSSASEFAQRVAADLREPLGPQVRRPFRRPPPQPLHLPEVQDIMGETGSGYPSPAPSFVAQPAFDIPTPQRYYTDIEEDSPIEHAAHDQNISDASTSSDVADQPTGASKVGQAGNIVGTFWDGKSLSGNSKNGQVLSSVYSC